MSSARKETFKWPRVREVKQSSHSISESLVSFGDRSKLRKSRAKVIESMQLARLIKILRISRCFISTTVFKLSTDFIPRHARVPLEKLNSLPSNTLLSSVSHRSGLNFVASLKRDSSLW